MSRLNVLMQPIQDWEPLLLTNWMSWLCFKEFHWFYCDCILVCACLCIASLGKQQLIWRHFLVSVYGILSEETTSSKAVRYDALNLIWIMLTTLLKHKGVLCSQWYKAVKPKTHGKNCTVLSMRSNVIITWNFTTSPKKIRNWFKKITSKTLDTYTGTAAHLLAFATCQVTL